MELEANMSAVASPVPDSHRRMTSAQLDQLSIHCIHPGTPMERN